MKVLGKRLAVGNSLDARRSLPTALDVMGGTVICFSFHLDKIHRYKVGLGST